MNTVNQTFDWSRFTAALRKEVVENKRMLIFTVICIYGFLTLIMILGNMMFHYKDFFVPGVGLGLPQAFVGSMLTLVICVAASIAFKDLKTKTSRAALFTSPSSTLEKFLVNILIYVVGIFVAFFVAAQLADLSRIAALWFFRSENFYVPGPMNFLTCLTDVQAFDTIGMMGDMKSAMYIGLLANAGLYLLGSIIWPRLSLLKTFAAIYAVEFCLFIIALPLFFIFGDIEQFALWMRDFITSGNFKIVTTTLACVQAVLYFGLAWYLFKRKDVISLKWWK